MASQSGGVGIVLLETARRIGLGVRHFVSLGNKADVSSNDLLAAWLDDPGVTAAALYLESFGNSAKFARIARRFSERKPLLAVVGGRSGGGQRAGASHTAAAATPAVRVEALFAQAGVIGCADADDLAQTALLLGEPTASRGRLGSPSSGTPVGSGVLAADALADEDLDVPAFSDALRDAPDGARGGDSRHQQPHRRRVPRALPRRWDARWRCCSTPTRLDAVLCILVRTRTMDWTVLWRLVAIRARAPPAQDHGRSPAR